MDEAYPRTAAEAKPDAADALRFLDALGSPVALVAIPPDGSPSGRTYDLQQDVSRVAGFLQNLEAARGNGSGANAYYVLNEPKPVSEQAGKSGKPRKEDIVRLRGVAVDLDPAEAAEAEEGGYERERRRLSALAKEALADPLTAPTAIVDSGNGIQMLWLFKEPIERTELSQKEVEAQARGLAARFGGDAVQSVEHLFRLPGTWNIPNKTKREKGRGVTVARLIALDPDRRYSLKELAAIAPPRTVPTVDAKALDGFDWPTVLEAAEGGVEGLPGRLREIAEEIPASETGRRILDKPDRSERDFALVAQCFQRGLTVTEAGQVAFALSPEKLIEKERDGRGEDYASRTLARAKSNAPPLRPEDFFEPVGTADETGTRPVPASAPRFRLRTIEELRAAEPPVFLVGRHIPQGGTGFLYGDPGSGKSFVALDLSLSIAHGLPHWHGDAIKARHGGKVLYIAGEGASGMGARIAAWEAKRLLPVGGRPGFVVLAEALDLMQVRDVADVVAALEDLGWSQCDLIVVDTVSRAIPGADENLQKDMTRFVAACDRLRQRFDCAVMGVHHTSKAGGMRGSSVLLGAGDFVLKLEKGNAPRTVDLECVKQKDAADGWQEAYALDPVQVEVGRVGRLASSLVPRRLPAVEVHRMEAALVQAIAAAAAGVMGDRAEAKWSDIWKEVRLHAAVASFSLPDTRRKFTEVAMNALGAPGAEADRDGQPVRIVASKTSDATNAAWTVRLEKARSEVAA